MSVDDQFYTTNFSLDECNNYTWNNISGNEDSQTKYVSSFYDRFTSRSPVYYENQIVFRDNTTYKVSNNYDKVTKHYSNEEYQCSLNNCSFTAKNWKLMYQHVKFAHIQPSYSINYSLHKNYYLSAPKDFNHTNKLFMKARVVLERLPEHMIISKVNKRVKIKAEPEYVKTEFDSSFNESFTLRLSDQSNKEDGSEAENFCFPHCYFSKDYWRIKINVPKLLAQLLNARVVLEKLDESLIKQSSLKYSVARTVNSHENVDRGDIVKVECQTNDNDYFRLYCAKCMNSELAGNNYSARKICSECMSPMTYLCTKCNNVRKYKKYGYLISHLIRFHGVHVGTPNDVLDDSSFIVQHSQDAKISVMIVRYCPKCDIVITRGINRRRNCQECREKLLYMCAKCNAKYNKLGKVKCHIRFHFQPKKYHCTQCPYTTTIRPSLSKHFSKVHSLEALEQMPLKRKLQLNFQRINGADDDDNFPCENCKYSTRFKCNLQRHIKVHH